MSTKPQIELFLENESGTQQVAYPFVESDHVSLSNGMDIDTMIRQDVSMPTVAHEDLSFKVGVGDQDVSSAIVDSSVAEMTIKGKTYQNILPEPSTHVLTNNKEMFKVNEGLDPNAEIVDGVSKSAILSGNTLVNLIPEGRQSSFHVNNTHGGGQAFWDSPNVNMIKPSTKYLILTNVTLNTGSRIVINNNEGYISCFTDGIYYEPNEVGIKKTILTSRSDLSDCTTILRSYTHTVGEVKGTIQVFEYQDGMENWNIPYFTGMSSVKMPVLTTTGKNLFDINGDINQKYSNMSASKNPNLVNGTTIIASSNSSSHHGKGQKIKVERGEEYTCSFSSTNGGIIEINTPLKLNYVYGKESTFTFTAPTDCDEIIISFSTKGVEANGEIHNFQLEQGTKATPYEPYKSNTLSTPEDLELRGIGDVQDALDCLTGEVTERIGEIVLDGSEDWVLFDMYAIDGYSSFVTTIPTLNNFYDSVTSFISGDFATGSWSSYLKNRESEIVYNHDPNRIGIRVKSEKASTVEEIKAFLSTNNIRINYKLATPVVKTVDLSSSGNWEKVVLDGSEDESWGDGDNGLSKTHRFYVTIPNLLSGNHSPIIDSTYFTPIQTGTSSQDTPCVQIASNKIHFRIERQIADSLTSFKTWLQQNPLTVWYPTTTHQDSTQVKQPIFFKDGHIQLSSGADNSLIPTLDYQAKTSNSYVMDLMKTNTKYTMKAKSASGTFTIDGTSYGAGTNETFTTPTSMTNKFLVMSNNANEEIMILEGDVTDKTIPYFKGIKSAFEGEDKIEVLSTSQNILDTSKIVQGDLLNSGVTAATGGSADSYCYTEDFIPCPNIKHPLYVHRTIDGVYSSSTYYIFFFDEDKGLLQPRTVSNTFTIPDGAKYLRIMVHKGDIDVSRVGIMVTNSETDRFNQSVGGLQNNTKIPLLSPLRSLPNGVCDELIIDRMKKKATLIQRIKTVTLDGSSDETWTGYNDGGTRVTQGFYHNVSDSVIDRVNVNLYCDTLQPNINAIHSRDGRGVGMHNDGSNNRNIRLCLLKNELIPYGFSEPLKTNENVLRKWLQDNPTTVYYQLETPVITEVDLEGFPYIYKDGHIFLNGEVTPVTEIKYSINQQHQIEANNQDIMRHQKEIDCLYKLIGEYVRVDYKNTLLSLNLELK